MIGIYPGEKFGSSEDKMIIVGAHWDTTGFTDGLNDNGSGVAAMIETVRALVESGCRLKYSVIFVAFDKVMNVIKSMLNILYFRKKLVVKAVMSL